MITHPVDFYLGCLVGIGLYSMFRVSDLLLSGGWDSWRRLKRLEDELQRRTLQRFEDDDDDSIRRNLGGAEVANEGGQYTGTYTSVPGDYG